LYTNNNNDTNDTNEEQQETNCPVTHNATIVTMAKKKIKWISCYARERLMKDLAKGLIPLDEEEMDAETAYLQRPEYSDTDWRLWASRLKSLRAIVKREKKRSIKDRKSLRKDLRRNPRPTHNHKGIPRWEGSVAERVLKQAVAEGKHENKKPRHLFAELVLLHPEIQPFRSVFRGHIHQEVRLQKFINYRNDKTEEKRQLKFTN